MKVQNRPHGGGERTAAKSDNPLQMATLTKKARRINALIFVTANVLNRFDLRKKQCTHTITE